MTDRLTLDTNLIIEYWKVHKKEGVVKKLLQLSQIGLVDLVVAARIREDVPREPLSKQVNNLAEIGIGESGSLARLGFWQLGRDQLGDEDFISFSTKVAEMAATSGAREPDWRDWDHLHAHYLQARDYFLTWDKGILGIREGLSSEFGIIVLTPEEYLEKTEENN
jgi:predicted nucleic acid-binding protein